MKKLLMILVGVIVLYLSSLIYRGRVTPITNNFPVKSLGQVLGGETKLYLILFFSMKNCPPCLEVIGFLNKPPDGIRVVGIVPEKEIRLLNEIRQTIGAGFPIYSFRRWRRYDPIYTPTLFGVGPDRNIYFVLPCVGLEEAYLPVYLAEFMRKAGYLLRAPD